MAVVVLHESAASISESGSDTIHFRVGIQAHFPINLARVAAEHNIPVVLSSVDVYLFRRLTNW